MRSILGDDDGIFQETDQVAGRLDILRGGLAGRRETGGGGGHQGGPEEREKKSVPFEQNDLRFILPRGTTLLVDLQGVNFLVDFIQNRFFLLWHHHVENF